jgi:hypothetical protein
MGVAIERLRRGQTITLDSDTATATASLATVGLDIARSTRDGGRILKRNAEP